MHKPDLIVHDVSMPLLDGLHAPRQSERGPAKYSHLFLTIHEKPAFVAEAQKLGVVWLHGKAIPLRLISCQQFAQFSKAAPSFPQTFPVQIHPWTRKARQQTAQKEARRLGNLQIPITAFGISSAPELPHHKRRTQQ